MMESAYGRGASAIEVLRGWERAPPQFKPLYSALQVCHRLVTSTNRFRSTDRGHNYGLTTSAASQVHS